MTELCPVESHDLVEINMNASLDEVELAVLDLPQVECSMVHRFGNGIYIRELTMPKGTLIVGHNHRHNHTNFILKGKAIMHTEGNPPMTLEAPMVFEWGPGRKVIYNLEETVWQNVHAIKSRDLDEIEEFLYDKSDGSRAYVQGMHDAETAYRKADLEDFECLDLSDRFYPLGDICDYPFGMESCVQIRSSRIHGKGCFIGAGVPAMSIIAPIRLSGKWTEAARFVNHSCRPNCFFVKSDSGDVVLMSFRDIRNPIAGQSCEELTIDYKQATKVLNMKEDSI